MSQNVQNIVDHGSRNDSGFLEETEKWISLTFGSAAWSETFWNVDLQKGSDVIQEKRSEFRSLSIGGTVKNIIYGRMDLEKTEIQTV